ncbi:DeoR/GlpR family DNA-binding transcription regulator [Rodentibacter abscessus]
MRPIILIGLEANMRNRDEIILQLINHQGKVSVLELAEQCAMSVETIRRDLNRLEKKGLLYRTHGGAVSKKTTDLGAFFQTRQHINAAVKRYIAKNALELLYENAVIGLDASSTSWYFAHLMPDIPCTVVTNSMFNINALVNKPHIKTIVTGGVYSSKYEAFYGPLSEYLLQRLHINFSVFSCSGIDSQGNIWESNELNASIKRKMMDASEQCYLLVDHSKFEKKSLIQLAELRKINTIFTDSDLPYELQNYCENADVMTVL